MRSHRLDAASFFVAALLSTGSTRAQEIANISLSRHAVYQQSEDGTLLPTPNQPFSMLAVVQMTPEFKADPNHQTSVLDVRLQPPEGDPRFMRYSESYSGFAHYAPFKSPDALREAFPAGTHQVTFESVLTGTTVYPLDIPDVLLPAPVRIVNYAAAQSLDPTKSFTLRWDPPVPPSGYAYLNLFDFQTGQLIHTSERMPAGADGIQIPAGTLLLNPLCIARLAVLRIDSTAVSNHVPLLTTSTANTLMLLKTATDQVPRFLSITKQGADEIRITIECSPGVPLRLEKSPELGSPWETVETVIPNASPATLTLTMDSLNGAAFFQAVHP